MMFVTLLPRNPLGFLLLRRWTRKWRSTISKRERFAHVGLSHLRASPRSEGECDGRRIHRNGRASPLFLLARAHLFAFDTTACILPSSCVPRVRSFPRRVRRLFAGQDAPLSAGRRRRDPSFDPEPCAVFVCDKLRPCLARTTFLNPPGLTPPGFARVLKQVRDPAGGMACCTREWRLGVRKLTAPSASSSAAVCGVQGDAIDRSSR